jgi:TRAP-type mannitol/chloroaromatic compound transport system substrate-binding protein
MAGKKIRSPEGLAAAVFKAAGASPVSIPFSEVYGALEKGIVDAAAASAYVNNDATGLHDVARYPLFPGIHSMPSMQVTINKGLNHGSPASNSHPTHWRLDVAKMTHASLTAGTRASGGNCESWIPFLREQ